MTARPLVLAITAATGLGLGFASAAGASTEPAQRAGVTVLPGLGGGSTWRWRPTTVA